MARYDRCFWLVAAKKSDMAWDKMDVVLLVREVTIPAAVIGKGPSGPGSRGGQSAHNGAGPRRERESSRGPVTVQQAEQELHVQTAVQIRARVF